MTMKKFLMTVAASFMVALGANAQTAGDMFLKPMVGGTLSTLTDVDHTKMRLGIVAGAEGGYHLTDQIAVTGGLLVSMQGTNYEDNDYEKDHSTTLTYLNIPIQANYYLMPGLAIKAGIQPGFLLSCKYKGKEKVGSDWREWDESSTDGLKKFDLSIPIGLSYEISDFVIDARYNLGLTKTNDKGDKSVKNSVFMLTLGYKIPF